MTVTHSLARFKAACLSISAAAVILPSAALGQVASPSNAGQNSGNNSAPSGDAFFATSNFVPVEYEPVVAGLVSKDTNILQITKDGSQEILKPAFQSFMNLQAARPLLPLFVSQPSVASATPLPIAHQGVLIAAPADVPVFSTEPSSSPVALQDGVLRVSIQSELVEISTTPATLVPLRRFAAQAVETGFTPASLRLGAQLVAIGSPVEPTLELMASLQQLAVQPSLKLLSEGIAAFNRIVSSSSTSVRAQLAADPVFIAASTALRTARNALPPAR